MNERFSTDEVLSLGRPKELLERQIEQSKQQEGRISTWIVACWILVVAFCIVTAAGLVWTYWLVGHKILEMKDVGGFLQGTVGVLITAASNFILIINFLGSEKQKCAAQVPVYHQQYAQTLSDLANARERYLTRLDRSLDARIPLLSSRSDGSEGDPISHVKDLLRWARSYCSECGIRDALLAEAARFLESVELDPYVSHVQQVFKMAAEFDKKIGDQSMVDHVWQRFDPPERALAALLIAAGADTAKPSAEALAVWRTGLEKELPWKSESIGVAELLT